MFKSNTLYKCHVCGTSSYQRVMQRSANGSLQPTGPYQCSGCRNVFESLRAWWQPHSAPEFRASRFPAA